MTAGIDLLEVISRAGQIIIVDVVAAGQEAGAVFRFRPQAVESRLKDHCTSLHQIDLMNILKIASFLGC
ncbi:MAG: hydrogenase maturation protease [Eubacteriales bacterium]|nr:hydrogenase maturation protease [Eubacteriales bacterium]MDN5364016.1 hydrogenase maturation protease [Eubacteriales bacterium]